MSQDDTECLFCRITGRVLDAHIVHEDRRTIAFLDNRPLQRGHTLLIPKTHVETLYELDDELLRPVFATVRRLAQAIEEAMGAEGTFIAQNNRVSQSVPHFHVHIVPRRKGDGLKGFFWPRHKYEDEKDAGSVATKIRQALEE